MHPSLSPSESRRALGTRARPPLLVVEQNILTLAGELWRAEVMLRFLLFGLWLEFKAALEGRHPAGQCHLCLGTGVTGW